MFWMHVKKMNLIELFKKVKTRNVKRVNKNDKLFKAMECVEKWQKKGSG